MKKSLILSILLILSACVTTETQNQEMSREEQIKLEEQKQIQRDMRHNLCVSRGHVVGSARYNLCMKVEY